MSSRFVQVSVVPAGTVMLAGEKLKLSMKTPVVSGAVPTPSVSRASCPCTEEWRPKPSRPTLAMAIKISDKRFNVFSFSAGERRVDDGERMLAVDLVDVGDPEQGPQ